MKIVRRFALGLVAALGVGTTVAGPTADEMIRSTVNALIGELQERRMELEADHGALYALVEEIVVPTIAVTKVSRLILGPHWKTASQDQRERFKAGFKNLLMRSYATAMFKYTGEQELRFGTVTIRAEGRIAVVPTKLVLPAQESVPIEYYCLLDSDGGWKIYDIQIDGISMIISYRNQYREYIDANGLDALVESLEAKASEIH
ncbi:MAG: ABC transporter substrate-binding protein [Arenicellales bacterium]